MRVPTSLLLVAFLLLGGALVTPARAGEHEGAEQIKKIKVQIQRLERKVHALRKAGEGEEAAALHRRAEELRRHLKELLVLRERRAGEHGSDEDRDSMEPKRRRAILRGLGQGIEALEALGRKEAAGHLRRIRDELKRGESHTRAREQAHSEREVVEGWIEPDNLTHGWEGLGVHRALRGVIGRLGRRGEGRNGHRRDGEREKLENVAHYYGF